MRSPEIRERFLNFFEHRGHRRLPSASLIPEGDPSLLFTVAGMVPLKPYINGQKTAPSPRLVSCQKCFRGSGLNDDISAVGDSTHHTFFEMLGNWSIGDYFKDGAIDLAWELLTKDFGLDPERLWPSIYPDDSESLELWTAHIGVPAERVSRFTDNWWQAGPTGPCGYDSELYWDRGSPCSCGRIDCRPEDECGGDRWTEIWNLVFMEFDQAEDGSRTLLPKKTVDTGMGLDRIASVLQGVRSNYETDLFAPIVAGFERRARGGGDPHRRQVALNVLADHVRGATFLIAEGVKPGNERQEYVLRRLIRRAALHGRRVDLQGGIAPGVADVVAVMGSTYPDIEAGATVIEATIRTEEETFARTLEAGAQRLESLLASGAGTISGDDAFRLYDTFGVPIELTVEMAAERGVTVDLAGYAAAMEDQRARSRKAHTAVGFEAGASLPETTFIGYESLEASTEVVRIGIEPEQESLGAGPETPVFLAESPFYAEAGGQVGDTGTLSWAGGVARVLNTTYAGTARGHLVRVEEGVLTAGTTIRATVDGDRRARVARHHSATHLLHRALRQILGDGVVQRGSYVGPEHTTFDFSFPRGLTQDEIRAVEQQVNTAIRDNLVREVAVMALAEARATGAVALFGEKYGDRVRVVDFGGWARELCGGTHVERSGNIGAAIIVSEQSIGTGIRRIEMVVGDAAVLRWEENEAVLREAARTLKSRLGEVPQRLVQLLEQNRELRRRQQSGGAGVVAEAMARAEVTAGDGYPLALLDDASLDAAGVAGVVDRLLAERLKGSGVAAVVGENAVVVKAAAGTNVDAGAIVKAATGGSGGGSAQLGRGGIKDPARRAAVVSSLREALDGARP